MKQNLIKYEIAGEDEINTVISSMATQENKGMISSSMAVQVTGWKPNAE